MPGQPRDDDVSRAVARRLTATREALGLTQDQFADLIGVSRSAYSNWELGRMPDVGAMMRLHERKRIPLDWIYCGDPSNLPHALAQKLLGDPPSPPAARRRSAKRA